MAEVVLREQDLRHLSQVLAGPHRHDPAAPMPSQLLVALQCLVPYGWLGVWEQDAQGSMHLRLIELPQSLFQPPQADCLTAQERRVLRLVATGRSNQQIAEELCVAASTVRKHLEHAFLKLGVTSRSAAVAVAFPYGVASFRGTYEPVSAGSSPS